MHRIILVMLLSVCTAKADDGNPRLRTELARVIVGEADGSRADWAAILWTLEHRRDRSDGLSLLAVAQYSVVLRVNTPRAIRIRSLGTERTDWGASPALRQKQWEQALAFVDEWLSGAILDPCPEAMHWDERETLHRRLTPVDCGETKNRFYAESGPWQRTGNEATSTGGTTP